MILLNGDYFRKDRICVPKLFGSRFPLEGFFRLSSQINFTLDFYLFARILLSIWSLRGFCFDSLNSHKEFGIIATSLCHDEDIEQGGP